MRTVGNDLVRHQLHENRKWYLGLGLLLSAFGLLLLAYVGSRFVLEVVLGRSA